MLKTITILFICFTSIVASHANGQVDGDDCSIAITATINGPNYFNNTTALPSAEPDPDESMCAGTYLNWNGSPDIWFIFTPTTTDIYKFTTCNLDGVDTSMVLYKGECDVAGSNLVQIACNGDSQNQSSNCQSYYSELEMELFAANDYFIRIGGYNGAPENLGFGELTISAAGTGNNGNIWYVDVDVPASGGGTSWSDAFQTIEDALSIATDGDQLWIAEGFYVPTSETTIGDPRSVTYLIREPIDLYGGFDGTEAMLEDRDTFSHHTILTGDINSDDNAGGSNSENAYHVITTSNVTTGSIKIDGFWIHGGNANTATDKFGGGIYIDDTVQIPIEVSRTRIQANAAEYGGAIANVSSLSMLSLLKVILKLNEASSSGGALYTVGDIAIDTSVIIGNTSLQGIGGGGKFGGNVTILNTTFSQNTARVAGCISTNGTSIEIQNSILWNNESIYGSNEQVSRGSANMTARYSCIENLPDDLIGNGNINVNPHFNNVLGPDGEEGTGDEDFHLFQGSPCIDAGDNLLVTTQLDIGGIFRFIDDPYTIDTGNNPSENPIADMGPSELRPADPNTDGVRIWSGANSNFFEDYENWLPSDIPGEFDTTLFSLPGYTQITALENIFVDSINVSTGNISIDLDGLTIQIRKYEDGIKIGRDGTASTLRFKDGSVYMSSDLHIDGTGNELVIESNAHLQTNKLFLTDGGILNLGGGMTGDLVTSGGIIELGVTNISDATLDGNLNEIRQGGAIRQPSEIIFDINGTNQGISHDHLYVSQTADLTDVIVQLRYSYAPNGTEVFNLIDAGAGLTGVPSIMTYSGLPSYYACQWATGTGLLGAGEATIVTSGPILFGGGSSMGVTGTPNDIVVADFDGINGPDVALSMPAVTSNATVHIFLNNGMTGGTWQGFASAISVQTGTTAEDLEIGDLDNDDSIDIVVTNYNDNTVTILLNDGTANFTTTTLAVGSGPISLAIGDFDSSDGADPPLQDLAVGCENSTPVGVQIYSNATVPLAGRSAMGASFSLTSTWGSPVPTSIDPTDVNDTKDLDLIILSGPGNSVTVKRGNGTGNTTDFMAMPLSLPTGSNPVAGAVSLLNSDLSSDYITINNSGSSISLLTGDGDTLNSPSTISTIGDEPLSISATDFDNDGDQDLVISELDSFGDRQLAIVRNDSTGGTIVLGIGDPVGNGNDPTLVATGDFDEDGLTDILTIIDLSPLALANSPAIGLYFNETALACPADVNGTGTVDVDDLLALIAGWGSSDPALDINGSGSVDVDDLLILIGAWGSC